MVLTGISRRQHAGRILRSRCMKNKNHSSTGKTNSKVQDGSGKSGANPTPRPPDSKSAPEPARASEFRISGRDYVNPVAHECCWLLSSQRQSQPDAHPVPYRNAGAIRFHDPCAGCALLLGAALPEVQPADETTRLDSFQPRSARTQIQNPVCSGAQADGRMILACQKHSSRDATLLPDSAGSCLPQGKTPFHTPVRSRFTRPTALLDHPISSEPQNSSRKFRKNSHPRHGASMVSKT